MLKCSRSKEVILTDRSPKRSRQVLRWFAHTQLAFSILLTTLLSLGSVQAQVTYTWDRIGVGGGGFHTGLAFTPDGSHVYVRGDVFGLHRYDFDSTDPSGGRWHQVLDWEPTTSYGLQDVDGLATDPKNANIVYALLGYAVSPTYTSPNDWHGLWVSTNKGAAGSWKQLLNVVVLGNNQHRNEGEPIAVDPFDDNVVYVGTRQNGLYISTNALSASPAFNPVSSSVVPFGDSDPAGTSGNSDSNAIGIRSLVIDPNTSITIGTSTRAKNIYVNPHNSGIWQSNDGGQSWKQITAANTPVIAYRMVVLADGSLVVTGNTGLVRYSAAANSWTNITPDSKGGGQGIGLEPIGRKRLVIGTTADDPNNPNPGNVYETEDATATTPVWKSSKLAAGTLRLRNPQPWFNNNFFQTYADHFVFNPTNAKQVWLSDVYGVWKTDDITATNVIWTCRAEGLGSTVNHAMVAPPSPGPVLLDGVEDVGAFALKQPNSAPIDAITPGGNQYPHSFAYCEASPLNLAMYTNSGSGYNCHLAASNDGGATWRIVNSPVDGQYTDDYGIIAMSSQNPNVAILNPGYQKTIYFTTNFQSTNPTWYTSTGGPSVGFASRDGIRLIASDKVNGSIFYATADTGPFAGYPSGATQVWKGLLNTSGTTPTLTWSVPTGQTFVGASTTYGPQSVPGTYNNDVVTTPGVTGDLYVQTNTAGVYHSTDGGVTFNLVVGPAVAGGKSISFDLGTPLSGTTPTMYYAGNKDTDGSYGVFRSTDKGVSWVKLTSTGFQAPSLEYILADRQQFGRIYVRAGSSSIAYGEDTASLSPTKGAVVVDDHTDPSGFLLGTNGSKTAGWGGVGYELYYRENMVGGAGQSVIYNYNGLTGFKFDYSFGYLYDSTPTVTASVSPTGAGGSWTTLSTVTTPGGADGANQIYTVRANQPIPSGSNYLMLSLSATTSNSSALGTVSLAYTIPNPAISGLPSAPTGLTATAGDAQVSLAWNPVTGATGYNVYRGTTPGGEAATPIATGLTVANYTDTTVVNGTAYYYTVKAANSAGIGSASNEANATPKAVVLKTVIDPLNNTAIAYSVTSHIAFDGTNPTYFQGDTSRATRSVDDTESIVYYYPGITKFDILAYSRANLGALVTVATSPDNTVYTPLTTNLINGIATGGGWNAYDIVPSGTLPAGTNYLKITLSPGSGYNWDPQISQVSITYSGSTNLSVVNAGFEQPNVSGLSGKYQYNPTDPNYGGWTFTPQGNNTGSGIAANGSDWGNPAAPNGAQVAFVQQNGSISQSVTSFATGTNYTIQVQAAQRSSYNPGGNQSVKVMVDTTQVGVFTPTDGTFRSYTTPAFKVGSSGSHKLTFQGTNTTGDSSLFLDCVVIAN